jgi:hypothetical protein
MPAGKIVQQRLSQYSALWLGSFLVMLGLAAGASLVGKIAIVDVADALLPGAFVLLGAATVVAIVATAVSSAGLGAKSLVTALALLLVLPLLWAPVLAILTVAAVDGAVIEYSAAYAGFRIAVSQLLYPLVEQFAAGSMLATAWAGFQILASIIGFLASALQVWRVVKGMLEGRHELTDG